MGKSIVSIVKAKEYTKQEIAKALDRLLEYHGGLEKIIPPHTKKVLIKPNLMNGLTWETGVTVNLDLLGSLIIKVQQLGFEVVVGEGAGWGVTGSQALEQCGAKALLESLNLPLYDFKRGELDSTKEVTLEVPDPLAIKSVTIDKVAAECDFRISLAKLKTHCETIVSLSLKNMKGLITRDKQRLAFHLLDVNKCIVDQNKVYKPQLSIVEGLIGLQGIGPLDPGKPIDLGILIAGEDPVAVDSTCCRIMGLDPEQVRHIKIAAENGLGRIKPEQIEIAGESLEDVTPDKFEKPPATIEGISPYEKIKIVPGRPCSNCIAGLASYLHGYINKDIVEKAFNEIKILVGAGAEAEYTGNEIAIGNCLKKYDGKIPYCPGCPPPSDTYLEFVEKMLLQQPE